MGAVCSMGEGMGEGMAVVCRGRGMGAVCRAVAVCRGRGMGEDMGEEGTAGMEAAGMAEARMEEPLWEGGMEREGMVQEGMAPALEGPTVWAGGPPAGARRMAALGGFMAERSLRRRALSEIASNLDCWHCKLLSRTLAVSGSVTCIIYQYESSICRTCCGMSDPDVTRSLLG